MYSRIELFVEGRTPVLPGSRREGPLRGSAYNCNGQRWPRCAPGGKPTDVEPDQDDKKLIQSSWTATTAEQQEAHSHTWICSPQSQGLLHGLLFLSGCAVPTLCYDEQSRSALAEGEAAVKGTELEFRVRMGHLPLYYVWLKRWSTYAENVWKPARCGLWTNRARHWRHFLAICEEKGPRRGAA